MGKDKLKRFAELNLFERTFQPSLRDITERDYKLKGRWRKEVFGNDHPLVLELGCGKGEYTIGLARQYPEKNFIGIDIKGARMWRGAKTAHEERILNTAFLRTRIEFLPAIFDENEVDEIWITFPDPQPTERRKKKRLTSPGFLAIYQGFMSDNGLVHLKTDNTAFYHYTLQLLRYCGTEPEFSTTDLYNSVLEDEILGIKTFYERKYLENGCKINYLRFRLRKNRIYHEEDSRT